MADIMGSAGRAWHEWKAHGRCSGLDPHGYFTAARRAYDSIAKPALFGQLSHTIRIAPKVVEQAFLEANPELKPDMVTVTCKAGMIAEMRICLTKTLQLRSCGADVVQDCTLPAAQMDPPLARDLQHDLADMDGGFHPRMSRRCLFQREFRIDHRRDCAAGQQVPNLTLQPLGDSGLGDIGLRP